MTAPAKLDTADLVRQVKALYRQVAQHPSAGYHFPLGRPLAEQLGYPAELTTGKRVLDLGSGSGTDSFAAALLVGPSGQVTGVDMTDEQRAKADRLRAGAAHIRFVPGRLEDLPFGDAAFDVVISNGVVNLCPDKARVFAEAAGLKIDTVREVAEYQFLTAQARNASREYGVRSITLAANRP